MIATVIHCENLGSSEMGVGALVRRAVVVGGALFWRRVRGRGEEVVLAAGDGDEE